LYSSVCSANVAAAAVVYRHRERFGHQTGFDLGTNDPIRDQSFVAPGTKQRERPATLLLHYILMYVVITRLPIAGGGRGAPRPYRRYASLISKLIRDRTVALFALLDRFASFFICRVVLCYG
jgi:hypothetical protein